MEMATEMQSTASRQQRGMSASHNQSNRGASQNERGPAQPGSGRASSSNQNPIIRSMSRYRGNRPVVTPVSVPVPSIDRSLTQKHPPRNSSLQKRESPRDAEENDARSGDVRPRAQSVGRSHPEEIFDTGAYANENRNTYSSRRRPTHLGEDLKPQIHEPTVNGGDREYATAAEIPQKRTERRHSFTENGHRLRPITNGLRNRNPDGENAHEQPSGTAQPSGPSRSQQNTGYDRQKKTTVSASPTLAPPRQMASKKSFTERMVGHIRSSNKNSDKTVLKKMISTPITIGTGGEASVPQFDAPISAVNAGERRVIVKSRDFVISLPVTPSTTPVDIIRSIGSHEPGTVDVNSSVLVESFKQCGLERPIRRYEHIRDILNSWDTDTQNTLFVEPGPGGAGDENLHLRNVSQVPPVESSFHMYYSQKPGHWDKSLITLKSDGQIVGKRNRNETSNICHLSDFDIYVPTPRQLSRNIKPPKKACFAIKSQQKSSMFLSTMNFVHFFATGDKDMARAWYRAVQEWRSWYLVNVMGKGQTAVSPVKGTNSDRTKSLRGSHRSAGDANGSIHRPAHGVETSGQQSDSTAAQTLQRHNTHAPQFTSVDRPSTSRGGAEANGQSLSTKPGRTRAATTSRAPPVSFPKKFEDPNATSNAPSPTLNGPSRSRGASGTSAKPAADGQEPFSNAGLLGRTYSLRQKAAQQNDNNNRPSTRHGQTPTTPSTPGFSTGDTFLKRTSSQRHQQKPKPLVDLTPVYQEPPQHSRKGKGVVPEVIPAGGLVDIATSPEIAIKIPPQTAWRRQVNVSGV